MTITQLEYILAVAKELNFRRAAESCNVTQPTLSAQIQKLEDELGTPVFDRSTNPVTLTKMGELIIDQAKIIHIEFERLRELVSQKSSSITGPLKVGIIPTISPYLLPLFLKNLNDHYPNLELNISELTTENCLLALDHEEIDVAILATRENQQRYSQESLFEEEMLLFVNKEHSFFKRKHLQADELEAQDIWLLEEGHCLRDEILKVCGLTRELHKRPRNLNLKVGNLESLRYLVQENFGYTLLPYLSTLKLTPKEKLLLKKIHSPVPTRTVYLTQRKHFLKQKSIEVLKEEILKSLPKEIKKKST